MSKNPVPPTSSGRPQPYMRLAELLMGLRITMGLRVVVERGIPDLLGNDSKTTGELASEAGLPAQSLTRLMRALSNVGVFREGADGTFSNTEVSSYLRIGTEVLSQISTVDMRSP